MEKYIIKFQKGRVQFALGHSGEAEMNLIYSCKTRGKGSFGGDTQKRIDVEQGSEFGVLWP